MDVETRGIRMGSDLAVTCRLALSVVCLVLAGDSRARAVTLTAQGLRESRICVKGDADPVVRCAAMDFQDHLERMTSIRVPVGEQEGAGFNFVFGGGVTAAAIAVTKPAEFSDDGSFTMSVDARRLVILGANAEAVSNGVYEVLHRLGCRWYFPGEVGRYVPRRSELTFSEGTSEVMPTYACRLGIAPGASTWPVPDDFSSQQKLWAARNRAGGWRWHGAGHSYQYLVPVKNYLKDHPEYFAQVKGKRQGPNLCTANAATVEVAARTAISWLKAQPRRIVCVSPPDGGGFWCECPLCVERYPVSQTNVSDRVVDFANRVGAIVRREFPDALMTHYIYSEYVQPPKRYRPEPYLLGWFTLWGTTGYSNHAPFTSPVNERARRLFEAHAELYATMGIHPYYGHYNWFTSWPMERHIAADMPYWARHKTRLFYSETHTNWATQWWNFYLMYRFAWDAGSDLGAIRTEFYRDFCGAAGEFVRAYDDLIAEAFGSRGYISGTRGEDYGRYTPEVLAKANSLMERARDAAVSQGHPYSERVEWLRRGFRINQLWCSAHHHIQAFAQGRDLRDKDKAATLLKDLVAFLKAPEQAGAVETDNLNFVRVIEARLGELTGGTAFKPGAFTYRDDLDGGGKALMHAKAMSGFHPRTWGLNLSPGGKGVIEWEPAAMGGVLGSLTFFLVGTNKGRSPTVEVSADDGKTYTIVSPSDPRSDKKLQYDLKAIAKGRRRVRVRVTAENPGSQEIVALDQIEFRGQIEASMPVPGRFEEAIRAFEAQDRQKPPPSGGILFVGSSTIRLWDTAGCFPGLPVINRGFGGSMYSEVLHFADRIILPYKPKAIVLYAGDNDLAFGKTPDQVYADVEALIRKLRQSLPDTRIVVLSIKLSNSRWALKDKMVELNRRMEQLCKGDSKLTFVDVGSPLLGPDGRPVPDLFLKDSLHVSPKGYEIWAKMLRPILSAP